MSPTRSPGWARRPGSGSFACGSGLARTGTVGELGRHLGLPASTLAHQPGALVGAGLVAQERRGRETVNRAAFATRRAVLYFVDSECCAGVWRGADDAA